MTEAERLVYAAAFATAIIDGTFDASTLDAYQQRHAIERASAAVEGMREAHWETNFNSKAREHAHPKSIPRRPACEMLHHFCEGKGPE